MNTKDYKEIARIIKSCRLMDWQGFMYLKRTTIAIKLADYFESNPFNNKGWKGKFNKKQFLKDCGVSR